MFRLQCDKNIRKSLESFFKNINIPVNLSEFNNEASDICLLRNMEDVPAEYNPKCEYIIVNSDDKELIKRIKSVKSKIITCGLSTRSTVTLSSVSETNGVICFQRSVESLTSTDILPFEFPFEICGKMLDAVSVLMLITAALICGADISLLKRIYI